MVRPGQRPGVAGPALGLVLLAACVFFLLLMQTSWQEARLLQTTWKERTSRLIAAEQALNDFVGAFGYGGLTQHVKRWLATREPALELVVDSDRKDALLALARLRELLRTPEDAARLDTLAGAVDSYWEGFASARSQPRPDDTSSSTLPADAEIEEVLRELKRTLNERLSASVYEAEQHAIGALRYIGIYAVASLALLVLAALLVLRSERRLRQLSEEQHLLFEESPDAVLHTDRDGKIIRFNRAASDIFGYSPSELIGAPVETLIPDELRNVHEEQRRLSANAGTLRRMGSPGMKIYGLRKDGSTIRLDVSLAWVSLGEDLVAVAVARDLSSMERLERESLTDHLTGVLNRRASERMVAAELSRHFRDHSALTLFLIDLDRFKALNDRAGHESGDEALRLVAGFLRAAGRSTDVVGRWGGDEFVLLCPGLDGAGAEKFADRLLQDFAALPQPWEPRVGLSIGYCAVSAEATQATTPAQLLAAADAALYDAKAAGRGTARSRNLL